MDKQEIKNFILKYDNISYCMKTYGPDDYRTENAIFDAIMNIPSGIDRYQWTPVQYSDNLKCNGLAVMGQIIQKYNLREVVEW